MNMTPDDSYSPILSHLGEGVDLTLAYRWRKVLSPSRPDTSQCYWIGPNGLGFHKNGALVEFKPANAPKALSISASPQRRKT
jgi:hypothetical protein